MKVVEFGSPSSAIEVVVPTADIDGDWFRGCLKALEDSTLHPVHIVAVESSGPEFNFPRSVNTGLARTRNDVLVLNDDAWLAPDALSALMAARTRWGEGVYQCYIHLPNGTLHEIGWSLDRSVFAPVRYAVRLRAPFATLRKLATGTFYPFMPHKTPTDGFDGFSFNASLVTRKALQDVGPLDEGFPLGWEDVDYSLRCHTLNVPYYSVPQAAVYHAINATRKYGDPREIPSYRRLREKWPRALMLSTFDKGVKGRVAL